MSENDAGAPLDPLLEPYIRARDAGEEEVRLTELVARASAVVRTALRAKGGSGPDQEDLVSSVLFKVVRRLHRLKREPLRDPIANFSAYVAVAAYNVHHAHLREQNPERQRLRNRIRYVVRNSKRYELWHSTVGEMLCGRREWRREQRRATPASWELPNAPAPVAASVDDVNPGALTRVLDHVFETAPGPIEIDRLTDIVAAAMHLPIARSRAPSVDGLDIADESASAETTLINRAALESLWSEIVQLPERQRAALLLNLRDSSGAGVLSLLTILGIASLEEVASAVGLSLQDLSALWEDLPLDDLTIGARLGITRQQVINLRKSARERLSRRLRGGSR